MKNDYLEDWDRVWHPIKAQVWTNRDGKISTEDLQEFEGTTSRYQAMLPRLPEDDLREEFLLFLSETAKCAETIRETVDKWCS